MTRRFGCPERPRNDPKTGEILLYRTRPKQNNERYSPISRSCIDAQVALYRWVKSIDFVNNCSIADLHRYLTSSNDLQFTKKEMGQVVHNSVTYDPTALIGKTKTNPVPCRVYRFNSRLDLEYGLEWQISVWLSELSVDGSTVEEDLEELVKFDLKYVREMFFEELDNKMAKGRILEPKWDESTDESRELDKLFQLPEGQQFTKDMIRSFNPKSQ